MRSLLCARAPQFRKPAVEAAGAVDAQNASTAPWKTAKNAVSHSYHRPCSLLRSPKKCYPCSRLTLLPMFPVAPILLHYLMCKRNRERRNYGNRGAVEECRFESPLFHRFQCGLIERWNGAEHARAFDCTVPVNGGLDNYNPLHSRTSGPRRIYGRHILDLDQLHEIGAYFHRCDCFDCP